MLTAKKRWTWVLALTLPAVACLSGCANKPVIHFPADLPAVYAHIDAGDKPVSPRGTESNITRVAHCETLPANAPIR